MRRDGLFATTLRDNRKALIGWLVAVPAVATLYASMFPSLGGTALADSMKGMPQTLRQAFNLNDLSSAAGYLSTSAFGILVPLLMVFFGASFGSRLVAGDEESGQLDLLLAHPVSRRRLVLQRWAALAVWAVAMGAAAWLVLFALRQPFRLGTVSPSQLAAQCAGVALLGVFFGALGVGVGAATGSRALAFAVTGTLGVASYVVNAFAAPLGADWAATLSPFHYYIGGLPLKNGWQVRDLLVLLAGTGVLVSAGVLAFDRRDVAT